MGHQPQLDPLIHPTNRLRVCAALSAAGQVEFAAVQKVVGLSTSALSKQIHTLSEAGYVSQSRDVADSRRIWLRLTPAGRTAYREHLAALQALIEASRSADSPDDGPAAPDAALPQRARRAP